MLESVLMVCLPSVAELRLSNSTALAGDDAGDVESFSSTETLDSISAAWFPWSAHCRFFGDPDERKKATVLPVHHVHRISASS